MEQAFTPVFFYLRQLLNQSKKIITEERFSVCSQILEAFEQWHQNQHPPADELHQLIDCKEFGEGLFEYFESPNSEEPKEMHDVWGALLCILLTIVFVAYQQEGQKYLPQDIEAINPVEISAFFQYIQPCDKSPQQVYDYFTSHVCF